MSSEIWLALAIVFIIEGIAPMLAPKQWQQMLAAIAQQPSDKIRKYAGCLVIAGITLLFML
jgi:uncharacterized protein YjeT (DUF2065 family)